MNIHKSIIFSFLNILFLWCSSEVALADNIQSIQTGRYLTVTAEPSIAQIDFLSGMVQTHFLENTKTIGEAITDVLRYSGYSLVDTKQQGHDLTETLKKTLPLIDRDLGPISLKEALKILIGPAFDLVVDPLHRTINFKLNSKFSILEN